jgi:hypothetical protein
MSVDAGYVKQYAWAIPWVWGLCVALTMFLVLTHKKLVALLDKLHKRLGRGIYLVRIGTCGIAFLVTSLVLTHIIKSPTPAHAFSPQASQSAAPPSSRSTTKPAIKSRKQSVKIHGDNDIGGNVDQSGNNDNAAIGTGNNVGNITVTQAEKFSDWLIPANESIPADAKCADDPMEIPDGYVALLFGTDVAIESEPTLQLRKSSL